MSFLRVEADEILARPGFSLAELEKTITSLTKPAIEVGGPTPILYPGGRLRLPYMLVSPYPAVWDGSGGPFINGISNHLTITNSNPTEGADRTDVDGRDLPFEDGSLSFVFGSALPRVPEDFAPRFSAESFRVLESSGLLVWQWVNSREMAILENQGFKLLMLRQAQFIYTDATQTFLSTIYQKP